jgi:ferredoxin-type protein NapF
MAIINSTTNAGRTRLGSRRNSSTINNGNAEITSGFSQNACTFCGDCARSCPTGALQFNQEQEPWHVRARIEASCLLGSRVLCRSCGDRCEHGAIRFPLAEGQLPTIAAEQCTGCGACASVCPVNAISFAATSSKLNQPESP